jgi:tetrahydromethanopterin S-methyltransferase subunit G
MLETQEKYVTEDMLEKALTRFGKSFREDIKLDTKEIVDTAIDDFAVIVLKHFNRLDERFDQVDKRFSEVDERFIKIDKRFESIEQRLDGIDHRLDRIDNRFEVEVLGRRKLKLAA